MLTTQQNVHLCPPPPPAELDAVAPCAVMYMGIPYPVAKRHGKIWYHETADGFRPFALQGRVRPVIEPQRGPK